MSRSDTNKKIDAIATTAKHAAARVEAVVQGATTEAGGFVKTVDATLQKLGAKAGHAVEAAAQKVGAVGERLAASSEQAMKKVQKKTSSA